MTELQAAMQKPDQPPAGKAQQLAQHEAPDCAPKAVQRRTRINMTASSNYTLQPESRPVFAASRPDSRLHVKTQGKRKAEQEASASHGDPHSHPHRHPHCHPHSRPHQNPECNTHSHVFSQTSSHPPSHSLPYHPDHTVHQRPAKKPKTTATAASAPTSERYHLTAAALARAQEDGIIFAKLKSHPFWPAQVRQWLLACCTTQYAFPQCSCGEGRCPVHHAFSACRLSACIVL